MKLIISPPRVGSVLYANIWHQNNPHYKKHIERMQQFNYRNNCNSELYVNKFKKLYTDKDQEHLVKILTVKNLHRDIYRYIIAEQIPTTFIYRRDWESWMLSAALTGASSICNVFEKYVWVLNGDSRKRAIGMKPKSFLKNPNIFNNLICPEERIATVHHAIRRCKFLEKKCNVENILYYEDIIKMPYEKNQDMPQKIHNMTKEELYNCFDNADEVRYWIKKYKIE